MSKINSLNLPAEFDFYLGRDRNPLRTLKPVSNLNILVGANNSGKSLFMRQLAFLEKYEGIIGDIDLEHMNSQIGEALNAIDGILDSYGLTRADTVNTGITRELRDFPSGLIMGQDAYSSYRHHFEQWSQIQKITAIGGPGSSSSFVMNDVELPRKLRQAAMEGLKIVEQIPSQNTVANPKKVYIPIVRGLRPLDVNHTDFYHDRTMQDYFPKQLEGYTPEIFTGLSFYNELTKYLLGSNQQRRSINAYQKFISQTLFEGKDITLVPSLEEKVVTVKIGQEKDRVIHRLGDGIQSAIILSFLPFMRKEPTFFFIEEPESHLHPGLQRKIMEFFASRDNHVFFVTSHSNHLLDITMDIQQATVFTFRKELDLAVDDDEQTPTFTIENVDSGHESSLELLGVRNSSVFLVNATIWVEGVTDRLYLRSMLKSYLRHLQQQAAENSQFYL